MSEGRAGAVEQMSAPRSDHGARWGKGRSTKRRCRGPRTLARRQHKVLKRKLGEHRSFKAWLSTTILASTYIKKGRAA